MSIAVWSGIYGLLVGYGVGVRVMLHQQRKAARAAAKHIKELTEQ